jgi:hypothetical protein
MVLMKRDEGWFLRCSWMVTSGVSGAGRNGKLHQLGSMARRRAGAGAVSRTSGSGGMGEIAERLGLSEQNEVESGLELETEKPVWSRRLL